MTVHASWKWKYFFSSHFPLLHHILNNSCPLYQIYTKEMIMGLWIGKLYIYRRKRWFSMHHIKKKILVHGEQFYFKGFCTRTTLHYFFLLRFTSKSQDFQAIHHVRVLNCPALDWNEKHIQVFNEIFFFLFKEGPNQ